MALFQTKITRKRFTFSPFTSEQMAGIGNVMLNSIIDRISSAQDVQDGPAKPLNERYARRKQIHGLYPIRNLYFSGGTVRSLKVMRADENRVTIGPTNTRADKLLTINNRMSKQWGISPNDQRAVQAAVLATFSMRRNVSVHRSSYNAA